MRWELEPGHSAVTFSCRHMMVTWVRGQIVNVRGSLELDASNPRAGSIEAEMDASSIWTGEAERDAHLRSADFLDVEKHPMIRFRSREVELLSAHDWRVHGELTLRGITKPVVLDVTYFGDWETPYWQDGVDKGPMIRAGFCATTKIDRYDFGVSWSAELPGAGLVVGREVLITIDVEALRPKSE